MTTTTDHRIAPPAVPFVVQKLDNNNNAKAIFDVPAHLAEQLVEQPILCCGSCFDLLLLLDTTTTGSTSKIYTEYTSMDPESTALEIAKRLANRIDDPGASRGISSMVFGGRR